MSLDRQLRVIRVMVHRAWKLQTQKARGEAAGAFMDLALHPEAPSQVKLSAVKVARQLVQH